MDGDRATTLPLARLGRRSRRHRPRRDRPADATQGRPAPADRQGPVQRRFHPARPGLRGDRALAASACADRLDRHREGRGDARRPRGVDRRRLPRRRARPDPARPGAEDPLRHEADRPPAGPICLSARSMLLPADRVRHVGEAVAMVVAETAGRRRSTPPRRSTVDYRGVAVGRRPARRACSPGATAVWDEVPRQRPCRHDVRRLRRRPTAPSPTPTTSSRSTSTSAG